MILIKKKKIFVRFNGQWINLNLQVVVYGGGLKGVYLLAKQFLKCLVGKHSHAGHFRFLYDENGKIIGSETYDACGLCNSAKKNINAKYH